MKKKKIRNKVEMTKVTAPLLGIAHTGLYEPRAELTQPAFAIPQKQTNGRYACMHGMSFSAASQYCVLQCKSQVREASRLKSGVQIF